MATAKKKKPAAKATNKPTKTKSKSKPAPKAKPVPKAKPAPKAPEAAASSKKAQLEALLAQPQGATIDEMTALTGWQKHTVRGFLSILKKSGKAVVSEKDQDERRYKIKAD